MFSLDQGRYSKVRPHGKIIVFFSEGIDDEQPELSHLFVTEVKNWGLEVVHRLKKSYIETQFGVIKRYFYRVDGPCYIVLAPTIHLKSFLRQTATYRIVYIRSKALLV